MEARGRRGSSSRVWRVAGPLVALVVAGVLFTVSARDPALPQFEASSAPLPLPPSGTLSSVSLPTFEGLLVGQRGRAVVVNVWASWCAPCRTEMPLLQNAAEQYAGRAVILGLASKDTSEAAMRFLEDLDITYPNVLDLTGEVRVRLGVTAFPTTYVFSPDGDLITRSTGTISEQRLAALIEDALE